MPDRIYAAAMVLAIGPWWLFSREATEIMKREKS